MASSEPRYRDQTRTYDRRSSVVFRKTHEAFGGLSNMAGGFPLRVNGVLIPSAEALYQACRFPHRPEVQRLIMDQHSPMTAKMVSKPHRGETRPDWMQIRVRVMRWVLRVKLAMHWPEFGGLLLATGDRPIVEDSRRDDFWGALRQEEGTLVGMNVLGRLLMELREELKGPGKEALRVVAPPSIPDFLLLEQPIGQMGFGTKAAGVVADPDVVAKPGTLWGSQIEGPEDELDEEPAAAASGVASEEQLAKQESTDRTMRYPKRLIEVDLPIKRISAHARREKDMRRGHIPLLHIYPAARPPAACRAVICAALWPDPADPLCPQAFREAAAREMVAFAKATQQDSDIADICDKESWGRYGAMVKRKEPFDLKTLLATATTAGGKGKAKEPTDLERLRGLLLDFIADFAAWEASTEKTFLKTARALTQAAHEALGGAPGTRPLVVDPFAGGGAIPLEALRVGADAFASDLNPVAVLLNKVVLEYIPKYGQRLADEVRKWGQWIKEQAQKELAEFYPKDPDGATPIAYLWARTINCEGPGCGAEVPLVRSFMLARKGKEVTGLKIVPRGAAKRVDFTIVQGKAADISPGTTRRGSATCPLCGYTARVESVRSQLRQKNGGASSARLLVVVTTRHDERGRSYRLPTERDLQATRRASQRLAGLPSLGSDHLSAVPDEPTSHYHSFVNRGPIYGMAHWYDYFTPRQLVSLAALTRLVRESGSLVAKERDVDLAKATQAVLALMVDKIIDMNASLCVWQTHAQIPAHVFGRWAIPMVFDFAEANPMAGSSGSPESAGKRTLDGLRTVLSAATHAGIAAKASATAHPLPDDSAHLLVTDPPYYYSVQYADLMDFFYVWLRRMLDRQQPELFGTRLIERDDEIIVQSPGHAFAPEGKNNAFYEARMKVAMEEGRRVLAPLGVGVVVFAHTSTSGWEALLQSLIDAGWTTTGSWPIDTEMGSRVIAQGRSVLASSVHIVCRPRENPDGSLRTAEVGDWREVLAELPKRIHEWMPRLSEEGIVGADAIFACLGPALEIFSRYSRVEKASGEQVPLREYLEHVWGAVAQEALGMIFKGADATGFEEDARLTAMWLWTLKTGNGEPTSAKASAGKREPADEGDEDESESGKGKKALRGYVLEYDAARKIAQGLGAHLENLAGVVAVEGETARLLSVADRTAHLFGKDEAQAPAGRRKKDRQMKLGFEEEVERAEAEGGWGTKGAPKVGETTLDRVHQAMILFASGRSEALKRFLVEEGVGRDGRFWTLAQALLALYPNGSDEKRWVDGVLARKKGLGF